MCRYLCEDNAKINYGFNNKRIDFDFKRPLRVCTNDSAIIVNCNCYTHNYSLIDYCL